MRFPLGVKPWTSTPQFASSSVSPLLTVVLSFGRCVKHVSHVRESNLKNEWHVKQNTKWFVKFAPGLLWAVRCNYWVRFWCDRRGGLWKLFIILSATTSSGLSFHGEALRAYGNSDDLWFCSHLFFSISRWGPLGLWTTCLAFARLVFDNWVKKWIHRVRNHHIALSMRVAITSCVSSP